jgi:hypothetical protein
MKLFKYNKHGYPLMHCKEQIQTNIFITVKFINLIMKHLYDNSILHTHIICYRIYFDLK